MLGNCHETDFNSRLTEDHFFENDIITKQIKDSSSWLFHTAERCCKLINCRPRKSESDREIGAKIIINMKAFKFAAISFDDL